MEAMRWSKPVITTYHAGIPELLNEFLVEENDVEQLKCSIELLLDNPELCVKSGEKNKMKIIEKFSEDNINILLRNFNAIR